MKLDLKGIFDNSVFQVDFDETIDMDLSDVWSCVQSPVRVKGTIYSVDDGAHLDGELIYSYVEDCARCLEEVSNQIKTEITGKIIETEESKLEESDETNIAYYKDEILLKDIISDAILLSMPMRVVCNEDCEGLCPECGVNRNSEKCTCEKEDIDPRLSKLSSFFDS